MVDFTVSATQIFGGGGVETFFAAGASGGASSEQQTAQVVVQAQQREINRIRGYKLQLSPAENFRLGEIQTEILKIQEKATNGTVRADELEDRKELYEEADRIIGKPILEIDTENDEVLTKLVSALETLMQPKLDPATQRRVDSLVRVKDNIEDQLAANPESVVLRGRFQSISKTVDALTPLRSVSQLSTDERRLYDEIVRDINDYTGVQLQLPSDDAIRVAQLEQSIEQMSANLPPDPSSQPTSGAVSRATARFA